MREDQRRVLCPLQLVAAPARHIARRAERFIKREEPARTCEFINGNQAVLIRYLVIDANRELIEVESPRARRRNVVRCRTIWIGEEGKQTCALFAPKLLPNLIAWERLVVVERILQRSRNCAEVAALHGLGRHGCQRRLLLAATLSFVTYEEESAVVANRSSKYAAELVATKAWLDRREEVASIQRRVAMKFESRAVIAICARLCAHDHLSAGLPAVLCRIGSGQNLELAHRIEDRPMQRLIGSLVVVVDAVFYVIVGDLAVTGDVESSAEPERRVLSRRENVWLQLCKLQIVAPVERKFLDLLFVHDVAEVCVLGLHHQRAADYRYGFLDLTDRERHVEARFLAGLQNDAVS